MRNVVMMGWAACLMWAGQGSAQTRGDASWTWSAQLSVSMMLNDTDWSISHPTYGGGGVTWETFTGTFTQRSLLQGSAEVTRKYLGVRGTLGVLPQRFTQDAPARDDDLRLVLAGLAAVLYPAAGRGGDLQPYVLAGAGGQKATGGMDNTGFYLTGAAGVRLRLDARVALDGGVQIHRLKYTQIELDSGIAKDVRIHPLSLLVGVRIDW
jgi:hypothetical protein